jgi:peptidoglycan/LPS O-acetylase OafA/YrhL
MTQSSEMEPFPLGQVWFLRTLLVISLFSPVYFWFQKRDGRLSVVLMAFPIVMSAAQMGCDFQPWLCFGPHNLYLPLVHSFFYIFGAVYFSSEVFRSTSRLAALCLVSLFLSAGLACCPGQEIDFYQHTKFPDLYYVSGSLAAICVILMLEPVLLSLCARMSLVASILTFMHRYTFPVFLLHGLSICLCEEWFGLVHPQGNYVQYAILKSAMVLAMTCIMAVPFGFLANVLTQYCLNVTTCLHRARS